MFKTLALATAVAAHEFTPYASLEGPGAFPAITTPMTFVQNAGQENFQIVMDQTNGTPDPPALGTTEQFTLSRLPTLSSDAGSSAPRSTTRSSSQPPPPSFQEPSGASPSHSMSHPSLHPPSTMLRSPESMPAVPISSP